MNRSAKALAILLEKRPMKTPAKCRVEGDFFAVMPYTRPGIYFLNHTGAALYETMNGERTAQEILDTMAGIFPEIPYDRLQAEITNYIVFLRRLQVIKF